MHPKSGCIFFLWQIFVNFVWCKKIEKLIKQNKFEKYFNFDKIQKDITIRNRKDGDKLKLKSGTKSVSNYLTDKKVRDLERTKVLLLCDSNNQPISILGFITK